MTRMNPFSLHSIPAAGSSKKKSKEGNPAGKALQELQAAAAAEKRELMGALQKQGTPGAMGVYAAQLLLQWLEDNIPCLSYRQRVDLVSGVNTRTSSNLVAVELAETLMAWWCRSEDPDEVGLRVELLITQGGLPQGSQNLLDRVRMRVNEWRVDQRLPRLREVTKSWEQLKLWAAENGQELDLELDAAVAAELTNATAGLQQELQQDEPLVFGRVSAHEARLWLLCTDWVQQGKTALDPAKTPLLKLERKAAQQLDTCLKLNVNHPEQIAAEKKRRQGIWDGSSIGILQDSRGRWFYGDGTPAIPQPGGGFKRQRSGLGGLFDDVDREATWSEIGRCFKQQKEKTDS